VFGKEKTMKKHVSLLFSLSVTALLFTLLLPLPLPLFAAGRQEQPGAEASAPKERVKLATTTSTDNSGLLEYLLPVFTSESGFPVDVIAVGTGAALKLGETGDADVLLVHAKAQEEAFVASGFGLQRLDVMYNDFVILGPPSDPANIAAAGSGAEAVARIAASGADFISRGDNSGTHIKELDLWKAAGITPEGRWYKEAGQGMGAVITISNDVEGYTLSDRGTWISMRNKADLTLLFEGDSGLFNPYGIIAVNHELHQHINSEGAEALVRWITSPKGQELIASFTLDGDQLFYPDARQPGE
jgi:tungstate transport system substrate-binding protein